MQIVFQFGLAPIVSGKNDFNLVGEAWTDGCNVNEEEDDVLNSETRQLLLESCAGNYANYRVATATTIFFLLAAVAAALQPTANRVAWPAKIVLWMLAVAGLCLVPNDPLYSKLYLNVARGTSYGLRWCH